VTIALATLCCGGEPKDEGDLSGLLSKPTPIKSPIDFQKVKTQPSELLRALSQPFNQKQKALSLKTISWAQITKNEKIIKDLEVITTLVLDSAGNFHAIQNNSKDYGREIIFLDGYLYLRSRYGHFHKRRPNNSHEVKKLKNQLFHEVAAYLGLLKNDIHLNTTEDTYQGHPVLRISITKGKSQKPSIAAEKKKDSSLKWRDTVQVANVTGEILMDSQHRFPRKVNANATLSYLEDKIPFAMKIRIDSNISQKSEEKRIIAPPADRIVSLDLYTDAEDRKILLEGLAPPERQPGQIPGQ